jgi:ribosomal-protein-alanine N-acetyltransferase
LHMAMKIDFASLKDLDAFYRIEKECFTSETYTWEQLAYLLRSSSTISFRARKRNEIVGFIIGMMENYGKTTVGHIVTIDVLPKHRRAGVGLRLLDKLEKEFVGQGVKTIYLEVRIDNQAARRLYAKKGYTQLEPLENYYDKGKHGLRMKKEFH